MFRLFSGAHAIIAFALISLGVCVTKAKVAPRLIWPLIGRQIFEAGIRLLPMVGFLACALGFVVIGQTIALLTRVGVQNFLGVAMVTVVVRELGPVVVALVTLARMGTAFVIDLGTARAMGEIEALEALCIDPVHYLVAPRMIALAASIFSLTVYFILIALGSGYLFAFLQNVPLVPGAYFKQLGSALQWQDFLLLALKTGSFGIVIAVVCCYQGLAQPLRIEQVSGATIRAVVYSVVACVFLDALFIVVYLLD